MRHTWAAVLLVADIALLEANARAADSFPATPNRVIVTFPPGGSADLVACAVQLQLEKRLGQPIIIDNRPGTGGTIGVDAVAKAAPDGYVIDIGAAGALAVNIGLVATLGAAIVETSQDPVIRDGIRAPSRCPGAPRKSARSSAANMKNGPA